MKSVEFCYWLQGFFELRAPDEKAPLSLSVEQVDTIRKHLALVFVHEIDPSYPAGQQAALNETHAPAKPPTPQPYPHGGGLPGRPPVYRC